MVITQLQTSASDSSRRRIAIWLSLCLALVALMVVVGGLTRLTESGLSIVEWKPVTGIVPPLDDTAFQAEFDAYQTSPQFKKAFPSMDLAEFKHIFWLEFIHRLLGRLIGMVFILPLAYFLYSKQLGRKDGAKLFAIFTLGGAQGLIGWYMVKSGLVNDPSVSPYRLALHLLTGFTLFGLILWQILSFSYPRIAEEGFDLPPPPDYLRYFSVVILFTILLQVMLGAAVAGQHAGLIYNTFPLMDGQFIPDGLWPQDIWYKNIFEDVTTSQFIHRMTAYALCLLIPAFWFSGRNNPHITHLLPILFSVLVIQFLLGILTLILSVPVPLASLHQANALLLFAISVAILHRLFIPLKRLAYDAGLFPLSLGEHSGAN
jgi:cytochrome c oxidase assembly protein subunit 15